MRQPASQAVSPALDVTIVFGLACHLCTDAEDALAGFRAGRWTGSSPTGP